MRRSCLLVGFFFYSLFTFADELRIVTSGGLQGVANMRGEIVVPAIYQKLGWSDNSKDIVGESIGYLENGKWGIINIKSGKLSNARYATLEPFGENLYEAGITGRFTNIIFKGLIDSKSKVHLDFNYYTIEILDDELWLVSEYNIKKLDYGVVSTENKRILPSKFKSIEKKGDVLLVQNKDEKFKLFDDEGNPLSEVWMDKIAYDHPFFELEHQGYHGRANEQGTISEEVIYKDFQGEKRIDFPEWEVRKIDQSEGKHIRCDSVIYDADGDLLIAHVNKAEHILSISEELFQDQQHSLKYIGKGYLITQHNINQKWSLYKTDGRRIVGGVDSISVDESYFYTKTDLGWEIYNLFGRKVSAKPIQAVGFSHGGNVPILKNGFWGWVDFQGNPLITCRYERVIPSTSSEHFIAYNYGKWGVRTFLDEWLVMPQYDSMAVVGDFYFGRKGKAFHVFNMQGTLIHQVPYALDIGELIKIQNGQYQGLLTTKGKYIYPEYNEVKAIGDYYSLKRGNLTKLIDQDGQTIISLEDQVEEVLSFSEGYFHIIKDQQHGFVDLNGKLRIANRYDSAQYFNENYAPVKLLGKWGFVDKQEVLVIQPYYASSSTFSDGLAIIQIDGNYALINPSGEEVIAPTWKKINRLATGNYRVIDQDGKMGLVSKAGRFILRANYENLVDSLNELVVAERYGKKGVLNYNGLTKIPFDYQDIKISGDYLLLRKK